MSQLNVDTIKKADGTGNLSVPAETGTVVTTASPSLGRRNLIINGAMQVAQRGTSASTGGVNGYFACDRWKILSNTEDVLTISQSSDVPDGFASSLKAEVTTADTDFLTSEYARFEQKIEGNNLSQLKFGTANAQDITLSFWVKSSITGGYSAGFIHLGAVSNAYISQQYTINEANTWEYKTLTFTGQTEDGFTYDNTEGLRLLLTLSAGSDFTGGTSNTWGDVTHANVGQTANVIGTLNATFQITGVQLEVGTVATPFEHRSYGEELALCQRYYYTVSRASANTSACIGHFYANNYFRGVIHFPVEMRSAPTIESNTGTNYFRVATNGAVHNFPSFLVDYKNTTSTAFYNTGLSGGTSGHGAELFIDNASAYLAVDAEL